MKFGQYELLEPIAIGGMAEIFKGRVVGAEGFEKFVAIKRILPDLVEDERFVKMLLTEARIHSALSHRNIVQIHDLGVSEGGEYFIVLEYVEGYDLRVITDQLAAEKEIIPEALSLHIAAEIAQGLHFAHELRGPDGKPLGLVHRDVTPSNVLISFAGEVKLSDFGLAKRTHDRSLVGSLKGNLAYMSPEQAMQAALDRRTDVFSLGAVLFELLTGRRLREITNEIAGWSQVASGVVQSVRALRPDLPEPVARLMDTALAADPARRFPDAAAFGAALRDALNQMNIPVGASDLAALLGVIKPPRRSRSLMLERSKVIRLGPDAAALREAAAAPKTPAPERRDPVTTVGVPVPPVRPVPTGARPAPAAPAPARPRVVTPATPQRPAVTAPTSVKPPAATPPLSPRQPTPANPAMTLAYQGRVGLAPVPPPRSRVPTPLMPSPSQPVPNQGNRPAPTQQPTQAAAALGGRAMRDPAATPPPPVVVPPADPDATPPPVSPLPPPRNRVTPPHAQPRVNVPVVPDPQLVRTPSYGVDRPSGPVFEIKTPPAPGAPPPVVAAPPGPPANYAPNGPPRPAGLPPGSRGRRSAPGLPGLGAGAPGFGASAPVSARAQDTARIQLRQRRSWAGVLFTMLLLVVGAAAAVHFYFVPLDVLITWREPAGLAIATDPRGAKLRLAGADLPGTAPLTISVRRDRADHIVEASLPGYRDARSIIRYDQSVALSAQLRLESAPAPANRPSAAPDAGTAPAQEPTQEAPTKAAPAKEEPSKEEPTK